ncbi:MAG: Gfo/Idh/MocA family oxidoreductase [Candidatus Kapabacteria bacterium]|nr:Gfo/Idh/MocA family oxidoreductase [Candidatus Kapabacteria bacterium]
MKNFAITGVGGYIAPRHLQAIKDTGNRLVAAVDIHDSVGILDRFFPDVSFFTEIERFDRHLEKLRKHYPEDKIDFLSICSPNHLHDAHIRLALRLHADAICEKPLVIKPWNLDALEELEEETGRKVYNILQLRVHPALIDIKKKFAKTKKKHDVVLTYITSRGPWYKYSWKGDIKKSGGIATNIGIHFFDFLMWVFGKVQNSEVHLYADDKMAGYIELQNANVRWFLSTDRFDLPQEALDLNQSTYRLITVDGDEVEFTKGFTDLHTVVYQEILDGKGFGISDARPSIELVYKIRNSNVENKFDYLHPFLFNK